MNKSLQEVYKNMELHLFKNEDLDNKIDRDKMIRDFILGKDMKDPQFEYLDLVRSKIFEQY